MGVITPIGKSVETFWEGLVSGRSGVGPVTAFDAANYPCQIAAEVHDFDAADYVGRKTARRMARNTQFAVAAAQQAFADAGLTAPIEDSTHTGIVIGTALGGFDMSIGGVDTVRSKGWRKLGPTVVASSLPNMAAYYISKHYGIRGYTATVATACASGTQAIGTAVDLIRMGRADTMVCGGTEALVMEVSFAGFLAMRGLSTYDKEPSKALRPFDKNRDGFLMGEGAAILILESLEHALQRQAKIYAEVLGSSASADAYSIAIPDPNGTGAMQAMQWALEDALVEPEEIDYINAHGASTPVGDAVESRAIKRLFREEAYNIPVSATKSMIAHGMGAAGALEAVACIQTLRTGIIHPTINYETPDPDCDLDYVPNQAREADVRTSLSNSFGLGGQNACVVLRRYQERNAIS
ncbi:MAG: beta-ketoacyl-ACP synthase II [Chloroflexi bacterium]|nr:beta-ketoacyl-ACP synthase II [Chloroflexota bacterium]